ncbi:bifunctional phosphoglucose/phosphomannose isomerase [Candidatus Woesearchaeota archaeon]|nr:bifunctional phosphoglucose/phosphomannose isomerase [Candidatus Woesearchaeota archaeon]
MPVDKSNYLGVLEDFPAQCRNAMALPKGITVSGEIGTVVVTGMGGSAIGGDFLKSYMHDTNVPVFVNRNYHMPNFVDEYTLVFAVSYSGNTEETLSAFNEAKEKGAKTLAITSGGKLAGLCEKVVKVPEGFQPRAALGYLLFPMIGVLHNAGIANVKNTELNETLSLVKDTEKFKEKAQELVKKIKDRVPVIYSSELLGPVAYRWKTQFNENAKCPAFHHLFPEMNHNELVGFPGMDRQRFVVVMIRDEHDNERIKKRMDICKDLMEERVDVVEVHTEGESLLSRMISTAYLGDFTSYYQALKNRVDPAPVDVITRLKNKLVE